MNLGEKGTTGGLYSGVLTGWECCFIFYRRKLLSLGSSVLKTLGLLSVPLYRNLPDSIFFS